MTHNPDCLFCKFASGQFKSFNDKNSFQVPSTARPIGAHANRIEFESDDLFFNCQPQAIEAPTGRKRRDLRPRDRRSHPEPTRRRHRLVFLVLNEVSDLGAVTSPRPLA